MELEIGQYGIGLESPMEFIGNFKKGKNSKGIENMRPMFRAKNGDLYIIIPDDHFMGFRLNFQNYLVEKIPLEHYKLKNYSYYFLDKNPEIVEQILTMWKNSNPLIHIGNYLHQRFDKIPNYTWTYRFNGKEW